MDEGYAVEVAANGLEALHRVERELPGLILLDLQMPVMDGWEFVRQFRQRWGLRVSIVVMTAALDAAAASREVSAAAVLAKPFELEALITTVNRLLPLCCRAAGSASP